MEKINKSVTIDKDLFEYVENVNLEHGFKNFSKALCYVINENRNTKMLKKAGRKGVPISKEELEDHIAFKTYKEVAAIYDVSVTTIQNKMKHYGITPASARAKKQAELMAKRESE